MRKIFSRAGRAALLDRRPFTEAFFDGEAAADGAVLVALVGAFVYLVAVFRSGLAGFRIDLLLRIVLGALASWLILAFATWFIATRLFGGSGRPQTVMGLHGLAALPLVLEAFDGAVLGAVALGWYLAVLVVATRESLEMSTRKAFLSVLIGMTVAALARALLGVPFALFGAL